MIIAHNHPSGDPTPSREDIAVTDRLVKAGKVMDIPVLDHVIIGSDGSGNFCSLKEKGCIH
jgi:DNA repair protein RadC